MGFFAAGGVLQMATATVNDLFPKIKGTITAIIMIASSISMYTVMTAAGKMSPESVLLMNRNHCRNRYIDCIICEYSL